MTTKDSKVERVNKDKDKGLFTGKPIALAETIAATPLVGGAGAAAAIVVGDIHDMESRISKDATPFLVGTAVVGGGVGAVAASLMESHIREMSNEKDVTHDKSGENI